MKVLGEITNDFDATNKKYVDDSVKNFVNTLFPQGAIYTTYTYTNPSTFIGGTWELIGGQDASLNYYPAFAIDTDTPGTTITESLPSFNVNLATRGFANNDNQVIWPNGGCRWTSNTAADVMASEKVGGRIRNILISPSQSNSIYKDNAHVNVNAIKLFFWRRTDSGAIIYNPNMVIADTIDSSSTNNEPAGAKAVYDILQGAHYISSFNTRTARTANTFTSGAWSVSFTLDQNEQYVSCVYSTEGNIGAVYVSYHQRTGNVLIIGGWATLASSGSSASFYVNVNLTTLKQTSFV